MTIRKYILDTFIISIFTILGMNSAFAQSLYREYSDNDVYMFINNAQQQYWTASPKMPHHELEIKNIGSRTITVRVLIKVVLRDGQGNYLDETTREKTQTIYPGATKKETIWMSTANKGNAYYCVEGFRVLSIRGSSANQYGDSRRNTQRQSSNYKAYTVKYQTGAYYYDFASHRFICTSSTWNEGQIVYLTGRSYNHNGITLLETTSKDNAHNSYWYIPEFAF